MSKREKKSRKEAGRYQYLAGNIALFTVSNFVSKILVFLLVPLYTGVLTTKEYGVADILQVTILLLVPALTENIGEAALRFGLEYTKKRDTILKTGLFYVVRADMIAIIMSIIVAIFVPDEIKWYVALFAFLFIANSLYEFLVLYFQGSEMVPVVVIGSVSSTVLIIASNLIFLLVIKIGLNGYIFSQVIAYVLASLVMLLIGHLGREENEINKVESVEKVDAKSDMKSDVKVKVVELEHHEEQVENNKEAQIDDDSLRKEMIKYSRPMLLYSTASWVNNAADRYIVAGLCGAAVNGVYGVAYKIPAILTVFQRIFAQAWQMSATKSYKDENSSEFFSSMYQAYNAFMVLGCSFLIVIVRFLATFLFKKDFFEAWIYVPFLLISIIFGALNGFLGSICLAFKDSKSMGIATGIGAAINIILNFISIPYFGALGAAGATAISYFVMCTLAFMFVKKHVTVKRWALRDYISYVILVTQALVMIMQIEKYIIWVLVCFAVICILYISDISVIVKSLWKKLLNHS